MEMSESSPLRRNGVLDVLRCTEHFGWLLVLSRFVAKRLPFLRPLVVLLEAGLGRFTDWRCHAFDRRYGTDTFTRVLLPDLGENHVKTGYDFQEWAYCPVNQSFFREMLRNVPTDLRGYTFIDVGAGKGKAVMLATEFPFDRIIGIELSSELAEIAKRNVDRHRVARAHDRKVEIRCQDFMTYPLPVAPAVLFFNNPFPLSVADLAIRHIEQSLEQQPRSLFVIWRKTPWDILERLDGSPQLQLVRTTPFWCIYRSRAGSMMRETPASVLSFTQ